MAEYRAAELPEGSVVAEPKFAWIRHLGAGAVVLRVGTGEEG